MGVSNQDYIMQILRSLQRLDYIDPDEIPNIDLYMDQVTTFMDKHLEGSKRYPDDKLLTKTMINNYTKNDLLPPPIKKKYSKEHMLMLIFIYYLKNIISINDIQTIMKPLNEHFFDNREESGSITLEEIYRTIFKLEEEQADSFAKDIIRKFNKAKHTFPDAANEEDAEFLQTFAFICMLGFDVYVKTHIIEKLIDKSVSGISGTAHKKKD